MYYVRVGVSVSPKGRTIDEYKKRVATGGTRNFQEDQSDVFFFERRISQILLSSQHILSENASFGLVCAVLVSDILTVNYDVKQN